MTIKLSCWKLLHNCSLSLNYHHNNVNVLTFLHLESIGYQYEILHTDYQNLIYSTYLFNNQRLAPRESFASFDIFTALFPNSSVQFSTLLLYAFARKWICFTRRNNAKETVLIHVYESVSNMPSENEYMQLFLDY